MSETAELVQRAVTAWQHDTYRDVMLPALGARTCSEMRAALLTMVATIKRLERERDGYLFVVAEIAASVALPDVIRVTGSPKDMISYFTELRARAEAAEAEASRLRERLATLEGALRKRIEWHKCSCPEPCDDYWIFPRGCSGRYAEDYRNLLADLATQEQSRAAGEQEAV